MSEGFTNEHTAVYLAFIPNDVKIVFQNQIMDADEQVERGSFISVREAQSKIISMSGQLALAKLCI